MSNTRSQKEENLSKDQILQIHCVECQRSTRHKVLTSIDLSSSESDDVNGWSVEWVDKYQITECQGCETITFRHLNWFSEAQDFDDDGTVEKLYPRRDKESLQTKTFHNVPTKLRRIYSEVIDCFNNDTQILCAAGLRALVEGICAEQKIKDGPIEEPQKVGGTKIVRRKNLEGKISGLVEKGLLTKSSAQTLHEHRYLGNSAVHELARPAISELKLAIEIVEHVLEQLYELPEKAATLRKARTKRST